MKNWYLLAAMALGGQFASAQTLINYGNSSVTKDEFLRAYNKNKPAEENRQKAIRDYAELYTNFKLKVKAAQEQRIDTLQQLKFDVENFRGQIIDNYLSDEKSITRLQNEAAVRMTKDIHVVYFSIPYDAGASSADSLQAIQAAKEVRAMLATGNTDYSGIAKAVTEKYSLVKQSDLGFVTAFTIPYEYENIVYNTPTGGVSEPYRSKNGWNIFKVTEQRPSAGKWKIAQVLLAVPPGADMFTKETIRKRADTVYNKLAAGAPFGATAREYSDDKLTYLTDGELAEFGTGKFSYAYEQEVFKLTKNGELSKPFETPYGFHIIKRIDHTDAVTDVTDAAYLYDIKQKLMLDNRVNVEKERFSREIVKRTGFKKTAAVKDVDLYRYADSVTKYFTVEYAINTPISKKTIATFTNGSVRGSDWLKFVREYKANREQYKGEKNDKLWEKFVIVSSVDYYKTHLEEYNPDFRFQLQEFREGNMLFEVMEKNVWNKALNDSAGLHKYYNTHKQQYKWGPSADVLVFNASSKEVADDALVDLKAGKGWRKIADDNSLKIQADSARYELSQIMGTTVQTPVAGTYSPVNVSSDGAAVFVKYLKLYPPDQQRSFEEARGLIINDYQAQLEKEWLVTLRKKYPVKTNEALLNELAK